MSDRHALEVPGGVDTHGETQTHQAAMVDRIGRHLAGREFPATGTGYRQLMFWLRSFGTVTAVGVRWMWTVGSRPGSSSGITATRKATPSKCVSALGISTHAAGAGMASLSSTHHASSGKVWWKYVRRLLQPRAGALRCSAPP
ncbi:hypothetical protein ACIGCZ_38710 [Streptomyces nigra]|uniref:hypothetical protein n=1 Tax=Streptomyces nigra TaxID=1827580 RepID=UPI0037D77C9A